MLKTLVTSMAKAMAVVGIAVFAVGVAVGGGGKSLVDRARQTLGVAPEPAVARVPPSESPADSMTVGEAFAQAEAALVKSKASVRESFAQNAVMKIAVGDLTARKAALEKKVAGEAVQLTEARRLILESEGRPVVIGGVEVPHEQVVEHIRQRSRLFMQMKERLEQLETMLADQNRRLSEHAVQLAAARQNIPVAGDRIEDAKVRLSLAREARKFAELAEVARTTTSDTLAEDGSVAASLAAVERHIAREEGLALAFGAQATARMDFVAGSNRREIVLRELDEVLGTAVPAANLPGLIAPTSGKPVQVEPATGVGKQAAKAKLTGDATLHVIPEVTDDGAM